MRLLSDICGLTSEAHHGHNQTGLCERVLDDKYYWQFSRLGELAFVYLHDEESQLLQS